MIENKVLSSKCRNLLKEYEDVLKLVIDEIRKEQDSPINTTSVEEMALEYSKRQGIRQGLALLMQKLSTKANLNER